MSIWPLTTADQLESMTLGMQALATRNKQNIFFQYDMIYDIDFCICQTKDCKNFCFSNKHIALYREKESDTCICISI